MRLGRRAARIYPGAQYLYAGVDDVELFGTAGYQIHCLAPQSEFLREVTTRLGLPSGYCQLLQLGHTS
jgi:hypothetical protein